jgi:hypothetical protein
VGNPVICPCSEWEEIHGFGSPSEFNQFVGWIGDLVKEGKASVVPVRKPYDGSKLFKEKWFRCGGCEKSWRLVEPDVPFRGVFEVVKGG